MMRIQGHAQRKTGQSLLEYMMLLGVIVTILTVMTPMIKRSIQAMVKVVADQVGNQQNADQVVDPLKGYMNFSNSQMYMHSQKTERAAYGDITYMFNDITNSYTRSQSEMGFTEVESE